MKKTIKEYKVYMPSEDVGKIVKEVEEEEKLPDFLDKLKMQKPVLNDQDEFIVITDNTDKLKNELKAEIIRQGYKSVTDFANKNHGRYKAGTIRMNLAKNDRSSEIVLAYVANKLGFRFNKKIKYELQK